jgi:hypothetical protein
MPIRPQTDEWAAHHLASESRLVVVRDSREGQAYETLLQAVSE